MVYSVLKIENGTMYYCQAPEPKPSGMGMESVRDFLSWQNKLVHYWIKPEHIVEFETFIKTAKMLDGGYEIPHELIKIFKDTDGKTYARLSNEFVYDADKGGIYALNHSCSICGETWLVEVGTEKPTLPFCTKCNEALKELIIKQKETKYGS